MTRLTIDQVDQLGLASLQERYPLPTEAAKGSGPDRLLLNGRSILVPETRFCPDCLTGDGSPIQESFGGPWRKIWHLPVVFACTKHQRLLEHRCPQCDQLVHGRRPRNSHPDPARNARKPTPSPPMPDGARFRQGPDAAHLLRQQTRPHPKPTPGRP